MTPRFCMKPICWTLSWRRLYNHAGASNSLVLLGHVKTKCTFFPSNAFMASARSFTMFWCMLQIEINWLIKSCAGRLRWNGLKSKLVEDRYVVLCTVTFHHQLAKRNKTTKTPKTNRQTKTKQKHKHTQNQNQTNQKQQTQQSSDWQVTSLWVTRIMSGKRW